jgi:hypothetical protein
MSKQNPTSSNQWSNFEDTRTHILIAGRELLLAAQGALKFCSQYVEASPKSSPNVKAFFKHAMKVANELGSGLQNIETIKKAAGKAIKPIFTTMEDEMASEKKPRKKTPTKSVKKERKK